MNMDLVRALQNLRVNYGTPLVYQTLMNILHEEHGFLTELFARAPPGRTVSPSPSSNFYNEFMELNAEAARETLQEQDYTLDAETVGEEFCDVYCVDSVEDALIDNIDELLSNTYSGNQVCHDVKTVDVEGGDQVSSNVKTVDVNVEKVGDGKKKGKKTKRFISKKSVKSTGSE